MNTLPALATRVLRRIGRVDGLQRSADIAEDRLEHFAFWADLPARRAALAELRGLRTVSEHFAFSSRFFGAHQIESEIVSLLEWAARAEPRTVCEIGTAMGGTTFLLGQALPTVKHLIGLDLFVRRRQRLQYFSHPGRELAFFEGSSFAPATVNAVMTHLGGRKLDILFIDGDHNFTGVASDFARYRHAVRDGGIIVFHDIVQDYRTRFGRQTPSWTGDVPRFWQQVKPFYETKEFVASPDQDGLGIGVIVYDSSVVPPTLI